MPLNFEDEFLPNQAEYAKLGPKSNKLLYKFICDFNDISEDYSDLIIQVPDKMPLPKMASNPISLNFLQLLVRFCHPSHILEIGSFVGVSTIRIAQAMPSFCRLTSVEMGKEFADLARKNVDLNINTLSHRVSILHRNALEFVKEQAFFRQNKNMYSMIFLDADKENYHLYLPFLTTLVHINGVIIVDDVLFHGDVINECPKTSKGAGVKKFLDAVKAEGWRRTFLPIANGILIMQKTSSPL